MVQSDQIFCLSCSISQGENIMWFSYMVHLFEIMISLGVFSFFQNFDFWSCCGGKSAKNRPKSLSCPIFQEPHIIQLSFVVHKCKMIVSLAFLSFFQNLDFSSCWWGKKAKNGSKKKIFFFCHALYLKNHTFYDHHLWYTTVNSYFQAFFRFFKLLIFWVVGKVKVQKMAQNDKKLCCAVNLKNYTS